MFTDSTTQTDIEKAARKLIKSLRRSEVATIRRAEQELLDACGGNPDLAREVQAIAGHLGPDDRLIVGVNGDVAISSGLDEAQDASDAEVEASQSYQDFLGAQEYIDNGGE